VHRGLAPFLLTEGVALEGIPSVPSPHFALRDVAGSGDLRFPEGLPPAKQGARRS
jgi:hypothetical protein